MRFMTLFLSWCLQLGTGCRADPRLLAAFAALAPGFSAAHIALRCEGLLAGMAPVLQVLQDSTS